MTVDRRSGEGGGEPDRAQSGADGSANRVRTCGSIRLGSAATAPLGAGHDHRPRTDALVEWNVAVPMRDGVLLRVNVFRPDDDERHPVLLCAHPYGKDALPRRRDFGPATARRCSTT